MKTLQRPEVFSLVILLAVILLIALVMAITMHHGGIFGTATPEIRFASTAGPE